MDAEAAGRLHGLERLIRRRTACGRIADDADIVPKPGEAPAEIAHMTEEAADRRAKDLETPHMRQARAQNQRSRT
jgi:hypothetical protein